MNPVKVSMMLIDIPSFTVSTLDHQVNGSSFEKSVGYDISMSIQRYIRWNFILIGHFVRRARVEKLYMIKRWQ